MLNKSIKLGATLLIVCAVAALVLAFTNNLTKDVIEEQIKAANAESVKDIFGSDVSIEELSKDELSSYKGKVKGLMDVFIVNDGSGNLIGHAIKGETSGYKGGLNVLTGIDKDGNILGVRVISHQETSGIGTKALTEEHLGKFVGLSTNEEVSPDGVSGATRTSDGIISGVNIAKECMELLK